jgi:hypothetical protein
MPELTSRLNHLRKILVVNMNSGLEFEIKLDTAPEAHQFKALHVSTLEA